MSTPNPVVNVESKIVAWVKSQLHWVHLFNAAGVVTALLKLFGKL